MSWQKKRFVPALLPGNAQWQESGFQDRLATGAFLAFGAPYDAEELACRETESQ